MYNRRMNIHGHISTRVETGVLVASIPSPASLHSPREDDMGICGCPSRQWPAYQAWNRPRFCIVTLWKPMITFVGKYVSPDICQVFLETPDITEPHGLYLIPFISFHYLN